MSFTSSECRVEAGCRMSIDEVALPSTHCPSCLGDVFQTHVRFDDDRTIAWYVTRHPEYVKCALCDAPVTLPTEVDDV